MTSNSNARTPTPDQPWDTATRLIGNSGRSSGSFSRRWMSETAINGSASWDANPWVWALTFTVNTTPED